LDLKAIKETLVLGEHQVHQEDKVCLAQMAFQELLETRVAQENQDCQAWKVDREALDNQAHLAAQDPRVKEAIQDQMA